LHLDAECIIVRVTIIYLSTIHIVFLAVLKKDVKTY
jgi:hypothetical protein